MITPPPVQFSPQVRDELEAVRPGLADETQRSFAAAVKPCAAMTATRVSGSPLRRGFIGSLIGRKTASPTLGPLSSKFGGVPYSEGSDDWAEFGFIGQIDLAEATAVLPAACRLRGLLRLDCRRRSPIMGAAAPQLVAARWFPDASMERAVTPMGVTSIGEWETKLNFRLAWSLPEARDALQALWPVQNRERIEDDSLLLAGFNDDGDAEYHRLLGHRSSGLDEWGPKDVQYDSVLRLCHDHAAGFSWGTNWVYVIVPAQDLARGDLSRVSTVVGNW